MNRVTIAHYLTQSGADGVVIQLDEKGRYSYIGKWGAGSGHSYEEMVKELNSMLRAHPRHSIKLCFWTGK